MSLGSIDFKTRSVSCSMSACTSQCSSPQTEPMSDDHSSDKFEGLSSGRVKLMCSYGGRILPRPHDNQLRYVGGETHILVVSRNILFADLMAKLTRLYGSSLVPKYQLPNEDLDVLVSVLSDEDIDIMMEEFDRVYSKDPSFKIRILLYRPKRRNNLESFEDPRNPEQRFLDAVNGLSSFSKGYMSPLTSSQDLDFLFGLDALAKQGGNAAMSPVKSSTSGSTRPALQSNVLDKESAIPLHSIALSQGFGAVSQQEPIPDKQFMLNDSFATEKNGISSSIITRQSEYSSLENDQRGTRMFAYVPLSEVSQDQLPKGKVLRQYSVEDSVQSSVDSPVFRHYAGIADDLSDLSDVSLDEQIDPNWIAYAHSKEFKHFSGKEGIVSGLNLRDNVEVPIELIDGSQISSGLRGHSYSNGRLNLLEPNADLIVGQQHNGNEIAQGVIDQQNVGMSSTSGEYWISEDNGRTIIMQRRASDPVLSSHHRQKFPSNRTSGTGYWQIDDDQQQYNDGAGSLPRNLVFLTRPVSTQLSAPSSMHRVASAPNIMKTAGDALPPRYVAASNAAQSLRHYDQRLPSPEYVPTTMRSSSRPAHRSPSRFRDLSPSGFQEQPTSRHQNSYHDHSVDATPHIDPTFTKTHYSEKPSKRYNYQGA